MLLIMNLQTILLILLLTITAPAFARIGDTKAQAEQRYGKGTKAYTSLTKETESFFYSHKGWTIHQTYLDGYAIRVQYNKNKSPVSIKPDEIQAIMKAESHHKWIKPQTKASTKALVTHLMGTKTWVTYEETGVPIKTLQVMFTSTKIRVDSYKVKKHLAAIAKKKETTRKKNIPTF